MLVVEDERLVRDMLVHLFLREGYEVRTASSGEIGYEVYRHFQPDLIWSDLRLETPQAGLRLAERIREHEASIGREQPVPFVLYSSELMEEKPEAVTAMLAKSRNATLAMMAALAKRLLEGT